MDWCSNNSSHLHCVCNSLVPFCPSRLHKVGSSRPVPGLTLDWYEFHASLCYFLWKTEDKKDNKVNRQTPTRGKHIRNKESGLGKNSWSFQLYSTFVKNGCLGPVSSGAMVRSPVPWGLRERKSEWVSLCPEGGRDEGTNCNHDHHQCSTTLLPPCYYARLPAANRGSTINGQFLWVVIICYFYFNIGKHLLKK